MKLLTIVAFALTLAGCASSDFKDFDWEGLNQVNRQLEQRYIREEPVYIPTSPTPNSGKSGAKCSGLCLAVPR